MRKGMLAELLLNWIWMNYTHEERPCTSLTVLYLLVSSQRNLCLEIIRSACICMQRGLWQLIQWAMFLISGGGWGEIMTIARELCPLLEVVAIAMEL